MGMYVFLDRDRNDWRSAMKELEDGRPEGWFSLLLDLERRLEGVHTLQWIKSPKLLTIFCLEVSARLQRLTLVGAKGLLDD